eukprot:TRINITY_DN96_c0_g1_i2.p1 TRINITY_DN96_c0_g1~~TRINITY_DN96_c0_g1_i2.p1  ORF type:complete len:275 (+),score=34.19 TRINITY_DN96_c0_g1_i2:55-879(+)
MAKILILALAVAAVAGESPYAPASPIYPDTAPAYNYRYGVNAPEYGPIFSQEENRNDYNTAGEYRVNLPDGRVQIVSYSADSNGYVADVKYEGEPTYPEPSYKPAPVPYKPAPVAYKPALVAYKPAPVAYKPTPAPYKPAPVAYKPAPVAYKPTPTPYKPTPAPYKPAPVVYKPAPYQPSPYRPAPYRPVYRPAYQPAPYQPEPTTTTTTTTPPPPAPTTTYAPPAAPSYAPVYRPAYQPAPYRSAYQPRRTYSYKPITEAPEVEEKAEENSEE